LSDRRGYELGQATFSQIASKIVNGLAQSRHAGLGEEQRYGYLQRRSGGEEIRLRLSFRGVADAEVGAIWVVEGQGAYAGFGVHHHAFG
jgi:hypothetical protein